MAGSRLDDLLERLRATEKELEQEIDRLLEEKREQFHYRLQRGRVVFERGVRRLQRQHRTGLWRYIVRAPLAHIVAAPVTYGLILPLVFFDVAVTVYQHICFRLYRVPRVLRGDYFVVDRHNLAYLNAIEKFNCVYCGYASGVLEYAREVAARTEQYWCPIKHARRTLDPHGRMKGFFDYGDAQAYRNGLADSRKSLVSGANRR